MAARQSSSPWVWVPLFLILGLFAGFLYFLDQEVVKGDIPPPEEATRQKDDKPRIDFYKILPDRKLEVPISEEDQQAIENPSINKAAGKNVVLQVGSFQSMADADSRKAQLAFLGFEAKIRSAVVNDETWYRVILGPYAENSQLSRTQNLLLENNIQYMQRSVKP